MISPGRVLQKYLFDHGTVPFWNLYLCGGQFELQNPQSYAFTWPSLFYYLMPPAAAIMVIWALLTAVGTWSTAKLLEMAGARPWIAWTCATAFTFSGYFGAHFNQGHATFCFFHLVPLLCWVMTKEWQQQMSTGRSRLVNPWLVIVVFLLFSAPAIQTLVYALPAVLILAAVLIWPQSRAPGAVRASASFAGGLFVSGILGVLTASYKFMPVLFQSLSRQRQGMFEERYRPALMLKTLLTFVSEPGRMWQDYRFPERIFGWWEYAAFISPVLLVLALAALYVVVKGRSRGLIQRRFMITGLVLMTTGFLLTLGNGFWLDVIRAMKVDGLFERFLHSFRIFPRFQVLFLFGATICCALFMEIFAPRRAAFRAAMIVLIAGPSLAQAAVMVHGIYAIPDRAMIARLKLEASFSDMARQESLFLSNRVLIMPGIISAQDLMIRRGAIIDGCYEQFFPVRPQFQRQTSDILRPATTPPLVRLENVTSTSFQLKVPADLDRNLVLNLPLVIEAKFEPEPSLGQTGLEFERASVAGRAIQVRFPVDDAQFGGVVSITAIMTAIGLYLSERRHAARVKGVGP